MSTTDRTVMQQALGALEDMNAGWRYIRSSHGDLYGVGWDRAGDKADAAIAALQSRLSEPEPSEPELSMSMFASMADYLAAKAIATQPTEPAAPAGQPEPVAWAVFAMVGGEMTIQYPVALSPASAKSHAEMYGKGERVEVCPLYATPQSAEPAAAPQSGPNWQQVISDFIEDYEMRGESEDGRDACYTPNENDKALLLDAIHGLLSEPAFAPLFAASQATEQPADRAQRDESPTFMGEPVLPNRWAAVQLERDTQGMCTVSLRVGGKWVPVIRDNGDVISHVCEPSGIAAAVNPALDAALQRKGD